MGLARLLAVLLLTGVARGQHPAAPAPARAPLGVHLADYDSELRRADGRIDVDALVSRLDALGVNTYYWLIWHAATDWDDLKLFLPKAEQANLQVWVYLVPPSEGSGSAGPPSQPFGLDFSRWAEEIARLSLTETNLTAWVIDDFYANHELFTPAYIREMRQRAKGINPQLRFLPLMYFDEVNARFAEDYGPVIDGVVVAYLQDREEIERCWAFLNDAPIAAASEVVYPWNTPSHEGDFALAAQSVRVMPGRPCRIAFSERDDFSAATEGYHFKQLLVDGKVVWEEDVAGGTAGWHQVNINVTEALQQRTNITIGFRLLDKKGVSNFGVRWQLRDLRAQNLQVPADFNRPQQWQTTVNGSFETGFGRPPSGGGGRFHIPFISMTAGDAGEFKLRHGEPATPDRIAQWLRMSLEAWRDGRCDGVVTYCLDKRPDSATFPLVQRLFREFRSSPNAR